MSKPGGPSPRPPKPSFSLLGLLHKLTPKLLALLFAFSGALLAAVTLFVSIQGGVVDLKNMVFKGNSDDAQQLKIAQHEIARLNAALAKMPETPLGSSTEAEECRLPNDPDQDAPNVLTMLCQLESMIPKFGSSISTNLEPDDERKKAYLLMQGVLRELGFYNGAVDGQQASTKQAVLNFQKRANASTKDSSQHIENFGAVGYKTLEAMRNHHRRTSGGA